MKKSKSLIAVAALIAAGSVSAQSSVTLFGIVDTGVVYGSGSISNKTQVMNSGLSPSSFGLRGTEDLGGSMRAGFWLESEVRSDTGTGGPTNTNNQASGTGPASAGGQGLTFNRRSTVSIGGNWGELRLGRDYAPSFWTQSVFNPFSTLGVGGTLLNSLSIVGSTSVRASNSIQYLYGHGFNAMANGVGSKGFHGAVSYFIGENNRGTPTSKDGDGYSVRVGYNTGPIMVAIGGTRTKYAAGDVQQNNIAGSYDFGVARVMATYERDKNGAVTAKAYVIGASIPAGPGYIRATYSDFKTDAPGSPETKHLALGYVYNLSKRTALYATAARVNNSGSARFALGGSVTAAGENSTGYDMGIRHIF